MDAAAEQRGLISRFSLEGDEVSLSDRSARRPEFLDDSDAVVGNISNPKTVGMASSANAISTAKPIQVKDAGESCARHWKPE